MYASCIHYQAEQVRQRQSYQSHTTNDDNFLAKIDFVSQNNHPTCGVIVGYQIFNNSQSNSSDTLDWDLY